MLKALETGKVMVFGVDLFGSDKSLHINVLLNGIKDALASLK